MKQTNNEKLAAFADSAFMFGPSVADGIANGTIRIIDIGSAYDCGKLSELVKEKGIDFETIKNTKLNPFASISDGN